MKRLSRILPAVIAVASCGWATSATATIDGLTRTGPAADFSFVAKADYIATPDGNSIHFWGYADAATGTPQYPGPTMIVDEGATVTVRLKNTLPLPVSIVFPGQEGVVAAGGGAGITTQEAPGDGVTEVTYTFTAKAPGTYTYYSGTKPELEIEMGLVGALIVRPASGPNRAYNSAATAFDREYLFLLTDMDPVIHDQVDLGYVTSVDLTKRFPVYWFINGRAAPDTMLEPGVPQLPTQPLQLPPGHVPGREAPDARRRGGHRLAPVPPPREPRPDRRAGRAAPRECPGRRARPCTARLHDPVGPRRDGGRDLRVDRCEAWLGLLRPRAGRSPGRGRGSGRPRQAVPRPPAGQAQPELRELVQRQPVPRKDGGPASRTVTINAGGGYYFMWHSHTEKEIVNWDVFPGGMMTMLVIESPSVPIP